MKPVFIVGMNGSGTTMLLDRLDRHPVLFGFPLETKLLPHYLTGSRLDLDLQDDENFLNLFREMAKAYPFIAVNGGAAVALPAFWRSLPRTPAAIFDCIMSEFAARNGKTRWCEKSPMHVQYITDLAAAFPDAQFVHVIRDGRDCAASFHRRWGYTPKSTVYRWKRAVLDGRLQAEKLPPDRYLEVIYERLTTQPAAQLAEVCDFLQVDYTDVVLQSERSGTRVKGRSELEIVPNSGRYKTYFNADQLYMLEGIAGATLASLGYLTSQGTADHNPPALLRHWWRLTDQSRVAARLVLRKSRSLKPFQWRLMASRLRRSLQQFLAARF